MADYGRHSQELATPQLPEYERGRSMSLGNNPNSNSAPEDGAATSPNGAGADGLEVTTSRPNSAEPETPKEVQEVLASDV